MDDNDTQYRGYRLVTDPEQGYTEIWYGSDSVTREDSLALAKARVDWYLEGGVR